MKKKKQPHRRSSIIDLSWCGKFGVKMGLGPSECLVCESTFDRQLQRNAAGKEARLAQSKTWSEAPYFKRGKPG